MADYIGYGLLSIVTTQNSVAAEQLLLSAFAGHFPELEFIERSKYDPVVLFEAKKGMTQIQKKTNNSESVYELFETEKIIETDAFEKITEMNIFVPGSPLKEILVELLFDNRKLRIATIQTAIADLNEDLQCFLEDIEEYGEDRMQPEIDETQSLIRFFEVAEQHKFIVSISS